MNILSNRNMTNWPSSHLIFEWEDSIAESLGCRIVTANKYLARVSEGRMQKFFPILLNMGRPKGLLFKFEGGIRPNLLRRDNSCEVVPCIVDYFLRDDQLDVFERQFSNNPIVLVSSAEVYQRLK